MTVLASIVEGHGEVTAFPALLRNILGWYAPTSHFDIQTPIRTKRDKFLNDPDEFRKAITLGSLKAKDGVLLVLLDADDDCPVELAQKVQADAAKHIESTNLSVVIANKEFEAWYIASASSLDGHRGFKLDPRLVGLDPEAPRDAKGWLGRQMTSGYHEVTDQPAFAALMNVEAAWHGSRSFRRLCSAIMHRCPNLPR